MRQILSRFCRFQVIVRGFLGSFSKKRGQTFCFFGKFQLLLVTKLVKIVTKSQYFTTFGNENCQTRYQILIFYIELVI